MNAGRRSPSRPARFRSLLAWLLVAPLAAAAQVGAPRRTDGEVHLERQMVVLDVAVTDRAGRVAAGLDRSNFTLFEDGIAQKIAFFADEDVPATIGIVLDVSRSMEGRIRGALEAITRFVETSHPEDEFFLVTFADRPQVSRELASDARQILNDLVFVRPGGDTALFDAVIVGLDRLERGRHRRRALLVVSDGQDNGSRYGFGEVRDRLRESDATVFAIGVTEGPYRLSPGLGGRNDEPQFRHYAGKKLLNDITNVTGGRTYYPSFGATTDEDLLDACTAIAVELRRRYGIGYYPSRQERDGRFRRVKVEVSSRDGARLVARTRPGYTAPGR